MDVQGQPKPQHSRAIRVVASVNFFLVGLYVVPITNHLVDGALRALETVNLASVVGWSLQLWVVGSTLFATGIFVRDALKKSTSPTVEGTRKPWVSDGKLLLSWWMTLLAICFYAFMLGRSGF
jgi:hypothetical protein